MLRRGLALGPGVEAGQATGARRETHRALRCIQPGRPPPLDGPGRAGPALGHGHGCTVGPPVTSARPPRRAAPLVGYVVEGRQMPSCGAFTPDGQVVLVSVGDAAVHRLDAESGEPLSGGPVLTRDTAGVVAVSGDGRRFIAQLADGTAQVWDVQTGRPVGPPLAPVVPEWQISFASRSVSSACRCLERRRPHRADLIRNRGPRLGGRDRLAARAPVASDGRRRASAAVRLATVVAFTRSDAVETWDLSPDATPDRDLVRLSGLLSGRRITPDGAIASVSADDLGRAWSDLHGRQPELPERPAESARSGTAARPRNLNRPAIRSRPWCISTRWLRPPPTTSTCGSGGLTPRRSWAAGRRRPPISPSSSNAGRTTPRRGSRSRSFRPGSATATRIAQPAAPSWLPSRSSTGRRRRMRPVTSPRSGLTG